MPVTGQVPLFVILPSPLRGTLPEREKVALDYALEVAKREGSNRAVEHEVYAEIPPTTLSRVILPARYSKKMDEIKGLIPGCEVIFAEDASHKTNPIIWKGVRMPFDYPDYGACLQKIAEEQEEFIIHATRWD